MTYYWNVSGSKLYSTKESQSALNLQVADENVILRRNALDALNDVALSCEIFSNFFSDIW